MAEAFGYRHRATSSPKNINSTNTSHERFPNPPQRLNQKIIVRLLSTIHMIESVNQREAKPGRHLIIMGDSSCRPLVAPSGVIRPLSLLPVLELFGIFERVSRRFSGMGSTLSQ